VKHCLACGHHGDSFNPIDTDHIKTRGSGGGDESWNSWKLCRSCHQCKHRVGLTAFANKWPRALKFLQDNGWEYCDYMKKWKRYPKNS